MKKHFTLQQIKWIVIICLFVYFAVQIPDFFHGLKNGWNSVR
jgi:hypothetical protein